jgi:hypothetical protein
VHLLQLQTAIEDANGDRERISSLVRNAATAGRLRLKGMKRLMNNFDALANHTTCLGESVLRACSNATVSI